MKIITEHPIAIDSNDHLFPHGAVNHQHDGDEFFTIIKSEFPQIKTILDLGTATGTFVNNGLAHGYNVCGVEGTDKVDETSPWKQYKNIRLFHADLRYAFTLSDDIQYGINFKSQPAQFDLITAWDVMEHMTSETIDMVLSNITKHLKLGGYFMATIEFTNKDNELYHHLCKPREWWLSKFKEYDLEDQGFHTCLNLVRDVEIEKRFWLSKVR